MNYYENADASGVPLVLFHGASETSSTYELRDLFDAFRSERPVIACDLPGYGFSERRKEPYARDDYVRFVEEMLEDVARRYESTVDVVAVGLSGELAGRAVLHRARLVRSLTLIAPTGFEWTAAAGSYARIVVFGVRKLVGKALWGAPLVGAIIHHLATSRPAVRARLHRATRTRPSDEFVRYTHAVTHHPRARHTVLSAMAGSLEDPAVVDRVYDALAVPVLFVHGDDARTPREAIDAVVMQNRRFARVRIDGAHALPHIEQPFETANTVREFHRSLSHKPQLRVIRGQGTGPRFDPRRPRPRSHGPTFRHA
jgi:pimeloyl-ACP methyl ester carboxylesterase